MNSLMGRRAFLKSAGALALMPFWGEVQASSQPVRFVSAAADHTKNNLTAVGQPWQTMIDDAPVRGHGWAMHPQRKNSAVMFARRPGTVACEVNFTTGRIERTFEVASNRRYYGHGCFSGDGRWLFTTEADYEKGQGKLGIRDALTYLQVGEYETFGIGPHDVRLLNDGQTLVVANGGILTHPNRGRDKLNLASMQPSLTYIDAITGQKIDEFRVPHQYSSIRHLDVGPDDTVSIAMQFQREAVNHSETVPLAAFHRPGSSIVLAEEPGDLIDQLDDYLGSTVIDPVHQRAVFTSPKGNMAVFWQFDGQLAGFHRMMDVCGAGLSADQKYFVLTNSMGEVRYIHTDSLKENKLLREVHSGIHWDNHLLVVKA